MDVINLLRDEHQQVMTLFDRFDSLEELSAKSVVAEQLVQQLMIHEEAEEDAVYSKVRLALPNPSVIDTAIREQAILKQRIRELVSDPSPDKLTGRMAQIRELVLSHVATEQNMLFPLILQYVPESRRVELGADFKSAKADHMAEMPSLSITMAPEAPVEQEQRS